MRASFILIILIFAVIAAGETKAEKEHELAYNINTNNQVFPRISEDGNYVVTQTNSCCTQNILSLFSRDNSEPLWTYGEVYTDGALLSRHVEGWGPGISSDGEYILTVERDSNDNENLLIFSKNSNNPIWSYTANEINSFDFSKDAKYILVSSNEGLFLINKDSNETLHYTNESWKGYISADGEVIVAIKGKNITLFNNKSSIPLWNYTFNRTLDDSKDISIGYPSISENGNYFLVNEIICCENHRPQHYSYLFSKDSNNPQQILNETSSSAKQTASLSADGNYIFVIEGSIQKFERGENIPLLIYEPQIHEITGNGEEWKSYSISNNGKIIAATTETTLYLFDEFGMPIWNVNTYPSSSSGTAFYSMSLSADGYYIITYSPAMKSHAGLESSLQLYTGNVLPIATIDSSSHSQARFDEEVTFSGSGTDSDGTILTYEWKSNLDGFLSNEKDFSTTFGVGNHTISFRVQDNKEDWSDWNTTVLEITNILPVGTLDSSNPASIPKGADGLLSGRGIDTDGTIVDCHWISSNDGVLSENENVLMPIENEDGTWTIQIVKINPQVSVNVANWYLLNEEGNTKTDGLVSDLYGYYEGQGKAVIFFDNDFNGKLSPGDKFEIHPGEADSDLAQVSDITGYTFLLTTYYNQINQLLESEVKLNEAIDNCQISTSALSPGMHTITFQVEDNNGGLSENVSQTLFVGAYPVASANHWNDDNGVQPNMPVQFRGSGDDEDGNIVLYEWDFNGDGEYDWSSTSSGKTSYSYVKSGSYKAVLRITDDDGLNSTDTRTIYVNSFGIDPVSVIKDNIVYILLFFALISGLVYWKYR